MTLSNVNAPARVSVVPVIQKKKKIRLEMYFLIEDFTHFYPAGLEYIMAEQKQF